MMIWDRLIRLYGGDVHEAVENFRNVKPFANAPEHTCPIPLVLYRADEGEWTCPECGRMWVLS